MAILLRPARPAGLLFLFGAMAAVGFPAPILGWDEVPQVVRGGGVVVILTRLPITGEGMRIRIEVK